jgi:hypothetical protein
MNEVARLSPADRADLFRASAERRALNPVVIEKDFWVCWVLKQLFTLPEPPAGLVFKGGTSLSKVFNAIERFSEDVDLSFDRGDLGFGGAADPSSASSRKKQQGRVKDLVAACAAMIREQFLPRLDTAFTEALGTAPGDQWRLEIDADDAEQQTVLFHYPQIASASAASAAYLRPFVRLEMGARGEHWPSQQAPIRPYAAEDFPDVFATPACTVKVVAVERTFWEKATILHMWHHAPGDKPLGLRQSRHYYDVCRLHQTGVGAAAIADLDLLRNVARHKRVFFASAWAKFDEAVPGTLRLVPPPFRIAELQRDYGLMREMIFGDVPSPAAILDTLRAIETQVNKS